MLKTYRQLQSENKNDKPIMVYDDYFQRDCVMIIFFILLGLFTIASILLTRGL